MTWPIRRAFSMMSGSALGFCLFLSGVAHCQRVFNTTVCEIADNPKSFKMKVVKVSGSLESDGIEQTVLVDQSCPQYGLALSISNHFQGEDQLKTAFGFGNPGTLDKTIHGTLTGRFVWRRKTNPRMSIIVFAAQDVSLKMKN